MRWFWEHRKLSAALAALLVFVALNVFAFVHARAMTHFTASGSRTEKPEALSIFGKLKVLFTGVRIPKPVNHVTPAHVGLKFAVRAIPGEDVPTLEVWDVACLQPRGRVLLFHGYAAAKASLLDEARVFHDLGYAVCLVDFRGSGGSDGTDTTIGVREAEDVARAFSNQKMIGPCILYGQSMGSAAILRAIAVHGIRPDAVIIESPFDRLLSTVENRFTAMKLPAFPCAQLLVFWGGVQQGFNGFTHNPTDYAREVPCPVLLMHGDQDARVTPAQVESIHQNLGGATHLEWFAGVGHRACCKARPDQWKRCVMTFLKEHGK